MGEDKHRPGWVYLMSNAALARNIVKIGLTQVDCLTRMQSVASAHRIPGEWRLEFSAPVRDAFNAEKALHRALDDRRLRWEFFKIPIETARAELRRITRPWRCSAEEVTTPPTRTGTKYQVPDRATKARNAAAKAVTTRKRRAAARKAVATRNAKKAAPVSVADGGSGATS